MKQQQRIIQMKVKLTKNNLKHIFYNMSRKERMDICREIYPLVHAQLQNNKHTIPAITHQTCVYIHSHAQHTGKISWRNCAKLFLVAEVSDARELQHWNIKGNSFYRKKNFHTGKNKHSQCRVTHRSRKPSIYSWAGPVVPRTFIQKHYPVWVQTQKDYDHYMHNKLGFGKEEFWRRLKKT